MGKVRADLYDRELSRYRETLRLDSEVAQVRYGMTLIHSLAPDEKVLALKSMGSEPTEAVDYYNLGVASAKAEDWNEAVNLFKRAAEINDSLNAAEILGQRQFFEFPVFHKLNHFVSIGLSKKVNGLMPVSHEMEFGAGFSQLV